MTNALLAANGSTLGRNLNAGSAIKSVQLIREGLEYGDQNLSQLDLRARKRFTFGRYRFQFRLRPLQRVQQQLAVHASPDVLERSRRSTWLRPTRALDGRMFKIGGQFDF